MARHRQQRHQRRARGKIAVAPLSLIALQSIRYRGHNYPDRFKVWISGQIRRVTKAIRREMRRRAAVEPVIGHLKDDHRMRRNYLIPLREDDFPDLL